MSRHRLVAALAASALFAVLPAAALTAPATAAPRNDPVVAVAQDLRSSSDGPVAIRRDDRGVAHFVGTQPGSPAARPDDVAADASPRAKASAHLERYGALFALNRKGVAVRATRTFQAAGQNAVVRFQQTVDGLPVIGGDLAVVVDKAGNLLSISGETTPLSPAAGTYEISGSQAAKTAVALAARAHQVSAAKLTASEPEAWAYDATLLGPAGREQLVPVWRFEVTGAAEVRHLVLVDRRTGRVPLHFNQVDSALNRVVCDRANAASDTTADCLTASAARVEGGPSSGVADVNYAYDHTGDTSAFYSDRVGIDLTNLIAPADVAGEAGVQKLRSTVRYTPTGSTYLNAFWNGRGMFYGAGFPQADDVVGHELSHGVTEHTSNLIYWYQSGAINESMSDIFGELTDLTNGHEIGAAQPWQIGEDSPLGVIRSMSNPPAYDSPDKMTSSLWWAYPAYSSSFDSGGVHINSGVGNKAAYLIANGGSFNGQSVTGLGYTKTARIYYETELLLASGADYGDLYSVLPQACKNLVGTGGITTADCTSVTKAVTATEMNKQPSVAGGQAPEAAVGCTTADKTNLYLSGFEGSTSEWTVTSGAWGVIDDYAKSGEKSLYGLERETPGDTYATLNTAFTVPSGKKTYLRFDHYFLLDYFGSTFYDGARLQYSAAGGTWTSAPSTWWVNGPNRTITPFPSGSSYQAFGGESHGYMSSRLDVSSLAGKSLKFRWRITTDSAIAYDGWILDNVNLYTCKVAVAATKITALAAPSSITYGSSAKISGQLTRASNGAAISGQTVKLYGKKTTGSTYALVSSRTTTSTGSYSFTVSPSASMSYYVDYAGGSTYGGSRASRSLPVRTKVTAKFSDNTVKPNISASLSGSVAPSHQGKTVTLQRYYSGAWHSVKSATLSSTSTYRFSVKHAGKGTFSYRVVKPADADHATGNSPTVKLYVS